MLRMSSVSHCRKPYHSQATRYRTGSDSDRVIAAKHWTHRTDEKLNYRTVSGSDWVIISII